MFDLNWIYKTILISVYIHLIMKSNNLIVPVSILLLVLFLSIGIATANENNSSRIDQLAEQLNDLDLSIENVDIDFNDLHGDGNSVYLYEERVPCVDHQRQLSFGR